MESGPILLFDGHCGLCDAAVQWILNRDVVGVFRMAPLHGETAAKILARHPELPEELDSLILVEHVDGLEVLHLESRSVTRAARHLPAPWSLLRVFGVVPAWFADPMYRWMARNRIRFMGRKEVCRLPSSDEMGRILP